MKNIYTILKEQSKYGSKWERDDTHWYYHGYCHVPSQMIVAMDLRLKKFIIHDKKTKATLYNSELIKPIFHSVEESIMHSAVLESVEHKETLRPDDMPSNKGKADGVFVPYWMLAIMLFILWWMK